MSKYREGRKSRTWTHNFHTISLTSSLPDRGSIEFVFNLCPGIRQLIRDALITNYLCSIIRTNKSHQGSQPVFRNVAMGTTDDNRGESKLFLATFLLLFCNNNGPIILVRRCVGAKKTAELLLSEGATTGCDSSQVGFERTDLPPFYDEENFKKYVSCRLQTDVTSFFRSQSTLT